MRTREQILETLSSHRNELAERFGVMSIALFGSASRGESSESSDVDVLVEFDRPVTLFDLASLEEFLSDVLETPSVDVVLRRSILPALRESILREAIDVR